MTKKNIIQSLCFLLVMVLILFLLAEVFRDKETTLSSFYSEPKDTVEVIILGGSHVNSAFMPSVMWSDYGISAHDVFSWNQPIWTSYYYFKEALRTQSPSVAVIDLFGMTYGSSLIQPSAIDDDTYKNAFTMSLSPIQYEMMVTSRFVSVQTPPLYEYLNLVRYHYRWKQIGEESFCYNPYKQHDEFKGYGLSTVCLPAEAPGFHNATTAREPYIYCIKYLDKIVKLAEKNDIDLVFTLTPYCFNETEREIYLWLQEYADEHDIPFLNYNGADGERIGIDYSTDLIDWGHVNYWGAEKITNDVARFLNENYQFPSRNEVKNHEQRDYDAALFERTLTYNFSLANEDDLNAFVEKALADKNYTLYYSVCDDTVLSKDLSLLLEKSGTMCMNEPVTPTRADGTLKEYLQDDHFITVATNGDIYVANERFVEAQSKINILLYDNMLKKPIEYAYVEATNPQALTHREILSKELKPLVGIGYAE